MTGVFITYKPGRIRVDYDGGSGVSTGLDFDLKKGDIILTYTDHGGGGYTVWLNGALMEMNLEWVEGCGPASCLGTILDQGKKTYWVKVKLPKSGVG